MERINILLARVSIFIIYGWFGFLKVLGLSPATPLVQALFDKTITPVASFVGFNQFIIGFGLFEVLIGILFLLKKFDRISVILVGIHLVTTALPLVFLGGLVWTKSFVPTLEGQYILKNIAILSLALIIFNSSRIAQKT